MKPFIEIEREKGAGQVIWIAANRIVRVTRNDQIWGHDKCHVTLQIDEGGAQPGALTVEGATTADIGRQLGLCS